MITNVPVLAGHDTGPEPKRTAVRVLVSEVHASSLRAVNYARSLHLPDTKAVFFAIDSDEARRIERGWSREGIGLPIEIVEAPYRDLGDPLLGYLREITADPETVACVFLLSSVPYHLP